MATHDDGTPVHVEVTPRGERLIERQAEEAIARVDAFLTEWQRRMAGSSLVGDGIYALNGLELELRASDLRLLLSRVER